MNVDHPFHFDERGRTAATAGDDHLRDLIEQLLLTNVGERVNRPDFGTGLMQLVFAPNSPELAAAVQFTLRAALDRWLGDLVALRALEVSNEEGTLLIRVTYAVRSTGESRTDTFTAGGA